MDKLWCLVRENAKAVAGFLSTALVGFLVSRGLKLPPEIELTIAGLISGFIVWLVPNRKCD